MISKYTIADLKEALDAVIIDKDVSNIVIHSSLFGLGVLRGGSIDELFTFFIDYFNPCSRIFFPTFTYSFRRKQIYNPTECQASIVKEMGILSKFAINSNRGLRSQCPMFSYYIIGRDNLDYTSRQSDYCFGKETLFNILFEEKTIFLGIGINYSNGMTPFIHIEKNADVPFRYSLDLNGSILDASSGEIKSATAIHFARNECAYKHLKTNSREMIGIAMEEYGISKAVRFNKSKIFALQSSSFYEFVYRRLKDDPFCMTEIIV